jgi:drug/metabolite transporter, DME family
VGKLSGGAVPRDQRGGGAAAVLVAAALWGSTGTAAAFAPRGVSPLSVGAARIVAGGAVLLLYAGLTGRGDRGSGLPGLILPGRRAWAGLSAVSMASYQVTFFSAVATTGVAVGTVVAIGSAPVLAGLVSRLTGGAALTRRWMLTTGVAIAGAAVLITGGRAAGVHPAGVALGLLAGLSYSLYAVGAARLIRDGLPERVVMGGLFGCAGVLLLPVLLAGPLGWLLTVRGAAVSLHLGLVTTAVAYLLYARGLRTTPVPVAVTLGLAEPAVATLLAVVVLGERLSGTAVAGLILIGLALAVLAAPSGSPERADLPSPQPGGRG